MISIVVYPQEREVVSVAELINAYDVAKAVTSNIAELRPKIDSNQAVRVFFERVVESQKRLESIIIQIAETNAPKEAQLYAISVAIAVKEAELAMWHYINGILTNQQNYLNSGDVFLRESIDELSRAVALTPTDD